MQKNGSGPVHDRRRGSVVLAAVALAALAACADSSADAPARSAAEIAGTSAPASGCAGVQDAISASTRPGGQVTDVDVGRACDEARVTTSLPGTAEAYADAVDICAIAVASTATRVGGVVVVAGDGTVLAVGTTPGDCAAYTG